MLYRRNHFFCRNVYNIIFFVFFFLYYRNICMIFPAYFQIQLRFFASFPKSIEKSVPVALPCFGLQVCLFFISSGQNTPWIFLTKPVLPSPLWRFSLPPTTKWFYPKNTSLLKVLFFQYCFPPQIILILSDQFISAFFKSHQNYLTLIFLIFIFQFTPFFLYIL